MAERQEAGDEFTQLRSVPVEHVLAETLAGLLNVAQAKLGRRDARLLIDLAAMVTEHSRDYVPEKLSAELDRALNTLRLGQVSAEREATAKGGVTEQGDLDRIPEPPASGGVAPPERSRPEPAPETSKLWVPGR
ncbi:hypothetical protein B0I33_11138 [Prauserella shujinwangii]|uniref:Uncharacterized protein n=1 Tax=Prauserella shujinwangii TaxID=1453103 RepID=A0A2T0LMW2_9PSEU|nr:hypothetical protein [Prauserella shujinwangii]PRX44530.1 hypothetical protein B0I33_11138 [Prauserella shujinwangii]